MTPQEQMEKLRRLLQGAGYRIVRIDGADLKDYDNRAVRALILGWCEDNQETTMDDATTDIKTASIDEIADYCESLDCDSRTVSDAVCLNSETSPTISISVYWDDQDPDNIGWAYRIIELDHPTGGAAYSTERESGSVDEWMDLDALVLGWLN